MRRKVVNLEKQRTNHTFNLPGLVRIATLFTDGVEFIEEYNRWSRSDMFK